MLSERAEQLFRKLIELYIREGQPVGSRTLARYAELDLSPATVRNVMSDLEELGLIQSPHTSAGRIPTQLGYRMFVDSLLKIRPLRDEALEAIQGRLSRDDDPAHLMESASQLLSQITHFAGVVLIPSQQRAKFRQIEFLSLGPKRILTILVTEDGRVQNRVVPTEREYSPSQLVEAANFFNETYSGSDLSQVRVKLLGEMQNDSEELNRMMKTAIEVVGKLFASEHDSDDVLLSGEQNLLDIPDLCNIDTLQKLFNAFKAKQDLLDLLDRSMRVGGISIFIGDESGYQALNDCSVVTAPYEADGKVLGTLGVIGPTRMSYEQVIPVVDVTARLLSSALSAQRPEQIE